MKYIQVHTVAKINKTKEARLDAISWNGYQGKLGVLIGRRYLQPYLTIKKTMGQIEIKFLIWMIYLGVE